MDNQRERFYRTVGEQLVEREDVALVLAEIGAAYLDPELPAGAARRVFNVGIREQLMVGVAAGLALSGLRPVVHTFAPFLVERPFEQVKLDLDHQGLAAVLVSAGGSHDWPEGGATHFGPRDVALLDTLDDWTVHVPGHPDEAEAFLRRSVQASDRRYVRLDGRSNAVARPASGELVRVRSGGDALVIAVGPMLDRVLDATADLDVTVAYTATPRPFDAAGLRALARRDVVLVEPYLAGTSAHVVSEILRDRPHRLLSLGISRTEQRRYGTAADHDRLHGIDPAGIRASVSGFLGA